MRWLVVLLACLAIAAAAWLLSGGGAPPPPASTPPAAAPPPPSPSAGERIAAPPAVAAPERAPEPAAAAADEVRAPAPPPRDERDGPAALGAVFLVVDEKDAPIDGATVQATAGERDLATGRTDARGFATLRGVPPDAGHRVRAEGFWPVTGVGCDPTTTTRVVLRRAPLLAGAVYGPTGDPVAFATVRLLPVVEGRLAAQRPPVDPIGLPSGTTWQARTDAGGRFEGPWPDDGAHDLVATAHGYAPAVVPALRHAAQGSTPVIVRLQAGATLAGVVLRADGVPLVDVGVHVSAVRDGVPRGVAALGHPSHQRAGQRLGSTKSRARGEFAVPDLPAGAAVVTLAHQHFAAFAVTTLAPGHTTEVVLRADENAALIGRVSDAAAAPASVFLYGGPGVLHESRPRDGEFAIVDVPPGRYLAGATLGNVAAHVAVVVQDFTVRGHSSLAMTIDLAPGEQRRLVLPPPVATTGAVTGIALAGGTAAARCAVVLEPVDGHGAHRREVATGADGAFRLEHVVPGDYDAQLKTRGDRQVVAEVRCRVRAGDTTSITLSAP